MKLKWKKVGLLGLALGMVLGTSLLAGSKTAYAAEGDVVEITEENFPDAALRNYVAGYDNDGSNGLSTNEIANITYVDLSGKGVTDLKGFEYLTSVQSLDISESSMSEINLSDYTWLKYVYCNNCSIETSLDVSGCENLEVLNCTSDYNRPTSEISEITLGYHPNLHTLVCYNTKIKSLDLSGCPNLKILPVYNCQLTELDLSACPNLEEVYCYTDNITKLTLGSHPNLTKLIAHENKIEEIDLSGCPKITMLTVFTNELTSLDVSACTKLETLSCHDNKLTELDVSCCPDLKSFSCHWNRLPSLDLGSNNAGFSSLYTLDYDEKQDRDRGQEIDGILYKTDDGYYIDLSDGLLDKSKVTEVEIGTYDSATGRIYLDDSMEIGDTVTYYYDTNGKIAEDAYTPGTPIMPVEVTITAIKDLTIPDEEPTTTEEPSVTEDPTTEDATTAPADVTTPSTEASEAEVNPSDAVAKTGDDAMPIVAMLLCMISVGCVVIAKKKKSE